MSERAAINTLVELSANCEDCLRLLAADRLLYHIQEKRAHQLKALVAKDERDERDYWRARDISQRESEAATPTATD